MTVFIGMFFIPVGTCAADDSAVEFQVGLQTPFEREPESKEDEKFVCKGEGEKTLCTNKKTGATWRFIPSSDKDGSGTWQQVIVGKDGQDILEKYAGLIYKWLAGFIGIVAVLMIVAGGIQIATAGVGQEGLQDGKNRIIAALVGLMLLFLSSLILHTINPTFFT